MKYPLLFLSLLVAALLSFFVLRSEYALVMHPQGIIAKSILNLIHINMVLMLLLILPTFFLILIVAWKYSTTKTYDPKSSYGPFNVALLWIVPSIVVAFLAWITWDATHELDPYRPLQSDVKPLKIQVVALNWKWLFIYPEQGVATVNFVAFPEHTPIDFELSADRTPMNSFWIPQLSGQIYAMTGMVTQLHLMAEKKGRYSGKAAEINGEGYAKMTFVAEVSSQADFDNWVLSVKQLPTSLDETAYQALVEPSIISSPLTYSSVAKDLFKKIVMKS